jgi:hypothetical protein
MDNQYIREIDRAGKYLDQDLLFTNFRLGDFDVLEQLGTSKFSTKDCFHGQKFGSK